METNLKINFTIEDGEPISVPAIPGETLLETARKAGVAIDAPCSGNGSCGKCRVRILSGEAGGEVSRHISPADHEPGWRLACAVKPLGDLGVFVPSSAGAFRNRIKVSNLGEGREKALFDETREAMKALGYAGDSGIEAVSLDLEKPSLDDPMADRERFLADLEKATGRAGDISLFALRKLPRLLREADFSLTCVIRREDPGDMVLDILPGGVEDAPLPALAIDIGTTTVAMALTDLKTGDILASLSAGNAQIRFGADVINRIIESTRPGGLPYPPGGADLQRGGDKTRGNLPRRPRGQYHYDPSLRRGLRG